MENPGPSVQNNEATRLTHLYETTAGRHKKVDGGRIAIVGEEVAPSVEAAAATIALVMVTTVPSPSVMVSY